MLQFLAYHALIEQRESQETTGFNSYWSLAPLYDEIILLDVFPSVQKW